MPAVPDPTDEQLFAMFNDTDGNSTYDGWLAIYRAGATDGIQQARAAVLTRHEHESDRNGNSMSFDAGFLAALDAIDALR